MSEGNPMPPCPYDEDDRVAFAYGELEPDVAQAFETHLDYCSGCRADVEELSAFAQLTRRVADQADPELDWALSAPAMRTRRPAWVGFLGWTGATAAVAAAVLLVLLMLPVGQQAPQGPGPQPAVQPDAPAVADRTPPAAPDSPAPKPEAAPVQRVAVEGALELRAAKGGPARAASGELKLQVGDRLATRGANRAGWKSADGTRLELSGRSEVALVQTAQSAGGERWRLERGTIVCQVAPREVERPFAVEAGPGRVVVKGTRFAVRLDGPDSLVVTVSEGIVAVSPNDAAHPAVDVRAGQQTRLERGQPVRVETPDDQARDLLGMAPAKPAVRREAKAPAPKPQPKVASRKPEPAPRAAPEPKPVSAPAPVPATPPEPVPAGPGLDATELTVVLSKNANWVFDGIRRDMRRGKYADALRKLNNYLGDPLAPDADEAVYLSALCLEQLGRIDAAQRTYRIYLERWPDGKRTTAAELGKLRTK